MTDDHRSPTAIAILSSLKRAEPFPTKADGSTFLEGLSLLSCNSLIQSSHLAKFVTLIRSCNATLPQKIFVVKIIMVSRDKSLRSRRSQERQNGGGQDFDRKSGIGHRSTLTCSLICIQRRNSLKLLPGVNLCASLLGLFQLKRLLAPFWVVQPWLHAQSSHPELATFLVILITPALLQT